MLPIRLVLLATMIALAGCGSVPDGARSWTSFVDYPVPSYSRQSDPQGKTQSSPELHLRTGTQEFVRLVLHQVRPDRTHVWYGPENTVLETINLRVILTSAQHRSDLRRLIALTTDPVRTGQLDRAHGQSFFYRLDAQPSSYRVVGQAQYTPVEVNTVLGAQEPFAVTVYREHWVVEDYDFSSDNLYWVSSDGKTVASRAQYLPGLPELTLTWVSHD